MKNCHSGHVPERQFCFFFGAFCRGVARYVSSDAWELFPFLLVSDKSFFPFLQRGCPPLTPTYSFVLKQKTKEKNSSLHPVFNAFGTSRS